MKNDRTRDEVTFKPMGLALAAVVAGLGTNAQAKAPEAPRLDPMAPAEQANVHFVDPTNHAGFEQDDSMILGPSEPVEPFAAAPKAKQKDLFDL